MIRIAVDGPSGAGKSTIAKALASRLSIDYIDTGAMYRAVGYKMLRGGVPLDDEKAVAEMLAATDIDFEAGNTILDGEIVNDYIRTEEISKMASDCSALPAVREKLVELQRAMGMKKSVVMDGRDIGTNVLKDIADYKFFLTASAEVRAERRFLELLGKGQDVTFEQVLEDIEKRDYNDTHRALNPLVQAEDAVLIDTDGLGIEEVTNLVLSKMEV